MRRTVALGLSVMAVTGAFSASAVAADFSGEVGAVEAPEPAPAPVVASPEAPPAQDMSIQQTGEIQDDVDASTRGDLTHAAGVVGASSSRQALESASSALVSSRATNAYYLYHTLDYYKMPQFFADLPGLKLAFGSAAEGGLRGSSILTEYLPPRVKFGLQIFEHSFKELAGTSNLDKKAKAVLNLREGTFRVKRDLLTVSTSARTSRDKYLAAQRLKVGEEAFSFDLQRLLKPGATLEMPAASAAAVEQLASQQRMNDWATDQSIRLAGATGRDSQLSVIDGTGAQKVGVVEGLPVASQASSPEVEQLVGPFRERVDRANTAYDSLLAELKQLSQSDSPTVPARAPLVRAARVSELTAATKAGAAALTLDLGFSASSVMESIDNYGTAADEAGHESAFVDLRNPSTGERERISGVNVAPGIAARMSAESARAGLSSSISSISTGIPSSALFERITDSTGAVIADFVSNYYNDRCQKLGGVQCLSDAYEKTDISGPIGSALFWTAVDPADLRSKSKTAGAVVGEASELLYEALTVTNGSGPSR